MFVPLDGGVGAGAGDTDGRPAGNGDLVDADDGAAPVLLGVDAGGEGQRAGLVGGEAQDDDLRGIADEHLAGESGGAHGVAKKGGDDGGVEVEGVAVAGVGFVAGEVEVEIGEGFIELRVGAFHAANEPIGFDVVGDVEGGASGEKGRRGMCG